MGRIIGIDYGTKRIGIAVTDPLNIIASPLTTVSSASFDAFIDDYTKKENVEAFVIGYPKQMDNTPSQTARHIEPFARKMKKRFPYIDIFLVDERFTSVIAMKSIIAGGVKKSDRQNKSLTDKVSAALILQSYIDSGIAIKKI
ncbi:MAG: Holliday junction resolvase RuvX [Bacteroidales bacterium]|jgi:putative Holliday junction resolvase|nr:Holliday junction resolvase RuvX [Bacteroidales bacterium]